MTPKPPADGDPSSSAERQREFWAAVRTRHPPLTTAVVQDAMVAARRRGERAVFRSRFDAAIQVLRLVLVTDSFLGQCCYRAKAAAQARRIPVVPRLLHHLARSFGHISIGDPVIVAPGVFIPHGEVVIDGITEIGPGVMIGPFVTIGLRSGDHRGPKLGARVSIGTGAKVIGPWTIGANANVGANAVVVADVAPGSTVVGIPARPVG